MRLSTMAAMVAALYELITSDEVSNHKEKRISKT
jgi:hypothetical protein